MNYEISNFCLANKIHMVTMLRLLLMRFIMASYEKKSGLKIHAYLKRQHSQVLT